MLRGLLRVLRRLLLAGAGLGVLFLGWRAFLHYGPGKDQAMFRLHAYALVRHRMAFPRPAFPAFLPAPHSMSSADVQLRLMRWWDGRTWLPDALAHGEPVKGGLRLAGGSLALVEVARVEPAVTRDGAVTCLVRARVRWNFPEDVRELHRVREIVGLRLAQGPAPGQTGDLLCTFVRKGWRWELVGATSPWGGKLSVPERSPGPLDWLL